MNSGVMLQRMRSQKRRAWLNKNRKSRASPTTLRSLSEYLKLSPATVSVVINDSPAAKAIPQRTKDRILKAARKLNYRANFFARSLSLKRGFTVGVLLPELSEGYAAAIMSGIEDQLLKEGYFYFVASHRGRADSDRGVSVDADRPGRRRPDPGEHTDLKHSARPCGLDFWTPESEGCSQCRRRQ